MKNYIMSGKVMPYTAPGGGVVTGTAYLIGGQLVVAQNTAAEDETFQGIPEGVVTLPKPADEGWTEGLKLYWDNSAKTITKAASGNTLVGVAVGPIATVAVSLATDAAAGDLAIDGFTATVLDFGDLTAATVTVTIEGVEHELVEGADWDAATSNNATATSLAAAIDGLDGVSAAAVAAVVTAVPASGLSLTQLTTGAVRLDGAAR